MSNRVSVCLVCILGLSLVFYLSSLVFVGHFLNFLSLLALLLVSLFWASVIKDFWIFFVYIFGFAFAALSGFFIEFYGLYMFEIMEEGRLSGAAAINSSLMIIFLSVSFLVFQVVLRRRYDIARLKLVDNLFLRMVLFVSFLLPVYLLVVVVLYGSPLFLKVDRFTYWAEIAPPGVGKVRYFLVLIAFVVSYAQFTGKIRWLTAASWLLLSLVALVLNGEKLSGFILIFYFYLIPYFVYRGEVFSPRKFFVRAGLVGIGLLALVLINYFAIQGDLGSAVDLFYARLALQGQMNYAVSAFSGGGQDVSEILSGFLGFGADEYEKGIYYLMYLIAPAEVVERRLQQGTTFTVPFPSNNLFFFGWAASVVVTAICGVLVGLVSSLVIVALRSRNFILSFLSVSLSYYVYGAVLMGNINKLFEWKFYFMLCVVLGLLLVGVKVGREKDIKMSGLGL